ncbi:unnamed protein product [Paramecium sonneborni]|uniref:Protein kinase domain-containing protein n=1 Tax=Paramecium sonneborni TaxID=65129 RepID=A0A8S1QNC9_9CILI|nr:unnamed protein product [Paramecium sonneborni]
MKKSSDLTIKTTNESESRRFTGFNLKTPLHTPFNRTHIRYPIKEYFPNKQYTQHTQHTSIQNTQPSIKSPPNSKPISLANALSLISKDETNPTSRRNSRRLHTNQLKNILAQEKVSLDNVRFSTQFQNPQPIIQLFTSHNSPKKSLKTSPDTKHPIIHEPLKNRISQKLSGHMYERLDQIPQITSDSVKQRISTLKQKLRGNIQQRYYKFNNNFTIQNANSFKEDIEYKFTKPSKPQLPQQPQVVLEHYQSQLTEYEKNEIKDFDIIYYLRPENVVLPQEMEYNFGFDTEKGDYIFRQNDHIVYRYEMLEQLGHGSFGYVFKVMDHKHQQNVAIKVIKNKEKFQKQAFIEIEILKVVNKADNSCCLIKMLNYFVFRNHVV